MIVHKYTDYCYQVTFDKPEQQKLRRIGDKQNRTIVNVIHDFIEHGLADLTDDKSGNGE